MRDETLCHTKKSGFCHRSLLVDSLSNDFGRETVHRLQVVSRMDVFEKIENEQVGRVLISSSLTCCNLVLKTKDLSICKSCKICSFLSEKANSLLDRTG